MSKKEKKVTKTELKQIVEQQTSMNNLLRDIGSVENQKHILLHDYATHVKEMEEFKKTLENKYGAVNIDLETGVYTKIEENV